MTTKDAIRLAVAALQREAEIYKMALRVVEMLGDDAPADAAKDARRHTKRIEAIDVLKAVDPDSA